MKSMLLLIGFVILNGAAALTCYIGRNCTADPKSCKQEPCKDKMDECARTDIEFDGCRRTKDCKGPSEGTGCAVTDVQVVLQMGGSTVAVLKQAGLYILTQSDKSGAA
ncbi:uncharacterized protein LOC144824427 [Lissotriton helveticus]